MCTCHITYIYSLCPRSHIYYGTTLPVLCSIYTSHRTTTININDFRPVQQQQQQQQQQEQEQEQEQQQEQEQEQEEQDHLLPPLPPQAPPPLTLL